MLALNVFVEIVFDFENMVLFNPCFDEKKNYFQFGTRVVVGNFHWTFRQHKSRIANSCRTFAYFRKQKKCAVRKIRYYFPSYFNATLVGIPFVSRAQYVFNWLPNAFNSPNVTITTRVGEKQTWLGVCAGPSVVGRRSASGRNESARVPDVRLCGVRRDDGRLEELSRLTKRHCRKTDWQNRNDKLMAWASLPTVRHCVRTRYV